MLKHCILIGAFGILGGNLGFAAEPAPEKGKEVTLLGMLSEYQYPGSKFKGAQSSDAGVTDIVSIKNKALLTTPDAVEKVVAFYLQKLNVDNKGKNLDEKPGERITTKQSVSVQDNSAGRPLTLYIIAITEKGSSTTLVVSRCEGEEATHIAWSNWRELTP